MSKSYLRRRGRLTRGQARALEEFTDSVIVRPEDTPVDWDSRFGRHAPLGLEIGFGTGQALLDWAEAEPGLNLLGIDVYQPGIGALLSARASRGIEHLLVIEADANVALETMFLPGSLNEIRIFFPDPWPKKRHHKRRLIQKPFAALLADKLADGGRLRLATDWEDYALWMREVLADELLLENEAGGFADRFEGREITRFEARGQRLGHGVWDLSYVRASRVADKAAGPKGSPE